jgi:DNA invertase Pin-like site-specific DNA recombinase
MAVIAQEEREMISARTKAALAAAKARGVKLGGVRPGQPKIDGRLGTALQAKADAFAASVGPVIAELRDAGQSLRQVAAGLTRRGIQTVRGGPGRQLRSGACCCGRASEAPDSANRPCDQQRRTRRRPRVS